MNRRPLLHLEGAAVFALSLFAYHWSHSSWLLFAVLREASGLGWREEFRDFALSIALLAKRSLRRGSDTALKLTVATKGRVLDASTRKIVWLREGVPASYQHYVSESHQKIPTGWRTWRTHFWTTAIDPAISPCRTRVYPIVKPCSCPEF